MDAQFDECPRIAEQVDPLPGGELAALVLARDLLLAAAELQLRPPRLEVTAFEAPEHEEERIAATETAMHVLEPFFDHLGAPS